MSASRGYRLQVKPAKQQRPFGVAALALLGVLGSIISIGTLLVGLWSLARLSIQPSRELAILVGQLVFALAMLRINWAFWEMLRWAWWANLLLTILSIVLTGFMLGYAPVLSNVVGRLLPDTVAQLAGTLTRGALLGNLALMVVILIYLFSVRNVFGVGVRDERPLWEKVRRF